MYGFKCRLVSWHDIERWVDDIIKKMEMDSYEPEIIIGMARGGIVPARIVSDRFQQKNLYTIKTEHWGITATVDGQAKIVQGLPVDINNRDIIIVDDITDTGQSMKLAYEYVKSLNPKSVKSSTLLHITRSVFKPDYFSQEVHESDWAWFIFPWNVYEDLMNILSKILDEEKKVNMENIKEILKKNFNINPEEEKLKEILKRMINKGVITYRNGYYTKQIQK
ncbi:MAG: phosphoribosyltransferase [Thermoplasmata archaeon]